jgi:hypothetical protein
MSPPTNFDCFVEPRIPISKRRISISNLIEPPIKGRPRQFSNLFESPPEKRKRTIPVRIVESPQSSSSKTISKKRVRPSKPRKNQVQRVEGGDWDGGELGFSSPEKASKPDDVIDCTLNGDEVETLKAKVVPKYWELLLRVPSALVRVTKRLYILQDWDRFGYLMVLTHCNFVNFFRTVSIGMFTE